MDVWGSHILSRPWNFAWPKISRPSYISHLTVGGVELPRKKTKHGDWSSCDGTFSDGSLGEGKWTASWWFQPIWKIISQIGSFPQIGVKIKNIWSPNKGRHCPKATFRIILTCPTRFTNPFTDLFCTAGVLQAVRKPHQVLQEWQSTEQQKKCRLSVPRLLTGSLTCSQVCASHHTTSQTGSGKILRPGTSTGVALYTKRPTPWTPLMGSAPGAPSTNGPPRSPNWRLKQQLTSKPNRSWRELTRIVSSSYPQSEGPSWWGPFCQISGASSSRWERLRDWCCLKCGALRNWEDFCSYRFQSLCLRGKCAMPGPGCEVKLRAKLSLYVLPCGAGMGTLGGIFLDGWLVFMVKISMKISKLTPDSMAGMFQKFGKKPQRQIPNWTSSGFLKQYQRKSPKIFKKEIASKTAQLRRASIGLVHLYIHLYHTNWLSKTQSRCIVKHPI